MHILSRSHAWPILGPAQVRQLEPALQALSPTPLMQSAGLACARLALAVAPHARRVWVAAGPGNNGGDGLEAALHLHRWGKEVVVSLVAFIWLVVVPTLRSFGRPTEKVAAGFLSVLLFATLVTVGVVGGMAYVFFSSDISGIVPWSSG